MCALFAPGLALEARADTATFVPVADASVDGSKHARSTNDGTATTLEVDKSPNIRSFLRFDVSLPPGSTLTGATLKLYTTTASASAGWTLYKVADTTWSETLITYNNQPALGTQLGSSGSWSGCPCFTQVSIPAAILTPGLNSFGLVTANNAAKVFHSREGTNVPQLVVTYTRPSLPTLSINDINVTEGNAGTTSATFSVSLSAPSAQPVTVSYSTADGSAVAPGDYSPTSGQLSFAPNETLQTIVVPVAGDLLSEPSESFLLNLSSPVNATLADDQGVGTIIDNEAPPLTLPIRAAFYYPWYPEKWQVGGQYPHDTPVLGHYDSSSQSVVDAHIAALDTASEYTNYYAPTWGRHKAKTYPVPGNHDHGTANLAGYCGYFGEAAHCKSGYSYYSFDLGNWHIIALDSGCSSPSACANPMVAGSEMRAWLAAGLAANTKPCTLAVWHHPRFSSGAHGSDPRSSEVWTELYNANVELVLSGHEHDYERFAPQRPSGVADAITGIRQFVVGTGGTGLRAFGTVQPNSEVRESSTHGVLKLTLRANSYEWEFVPIAGQTLPTPARGRATDGWGK